jgi:hypothetical protein
MIVALRSVHVDRLVFIAEFAALAAAMGWLIGNAQYFRCLWWQLPGRSVIKIIAGISCGCQIDNFKFLAPRLSRQ